MPHAPARCVGHSPYARYSHPPAPVRAIDRTAQITGSERVIAATSVLLVGTFAAIVGYVLGRLNLLVRAADWIDGVR